MSMAIVVELGKTFNIGYVKEVKVSSASHDKVNEPG